MHCHINSISWYEHKEGEGFADKAIFNGNLGRSGSFPLLKDFMVDDEDYINFLLENASQHDGEVKFDDQSQGMCATMCAGFSFIAVLFLVSQLR